MTVALSDCKLLCDMLQPLPSFSDAVATASKTADFYVRRKPMSATINTLANALYKVFCYTGVWEWCYDLKIDRTTLLLYNVIFCPDLTTSRRQGARGDATSMFRLLVLGWHLFGWSHFIAFRPEP